MYRHLGKLEVQDEIRSRNTDKPHCHYLKQSPSACIALPASAPQDQVGKMCPNNPFHKYSVEIQNISEFMPHIQRSFRLLDEFELGLISSKSELSVADFELVRAAKENMEDRRRKLLAKELSIAIAQLFGGEKQS